MTTMADLPALNLNGPGALQPGAPARSTRDASSASSPAFEALLERLTARAADLDARSREVARPEDLPGAVDAARASLEDALTLGERLLEAYQAEQHRGAKP